MKKLCGCFLAVFMWMIVFTMNAKAAEPKVMLTDYKVKENKITAGEEFELSITIYNTAKKNVKNMKVSIVSEAGEILPEEGAGTAYIAQLDAETEETLSFKMKAADNLEEKSYKVTVKLEYEDSSGYSAYTVEDAIYLPAQLEQRYSFSDITVDGSFILGEELEIIGKINNLGKGTLYNVSIKTVGDNISSQKSYIGNIETGKSGNVDMIVDASHISDGTQKNNYVIITYEDKEGKQQESKELLENLKHDEACLIRAPLYENLEKVKEEKTENGTGKAVAIAVVILITFMIFVMLFYNRWKRKKKIQEEFE